MRPEEEHPGEQLGRLNLVMHEQVQQPRASLRAAKGTRLRDTLRSITRLHFPADAGDMDRTTSGEGALEGSMRCGRGSGWSFPATVEASMSSRHQSSAEAIMTRRAGHQSSSRLEMTRESLHLTPLDNDRVHLDPGARAERLRAGARHPSSVSRRGKALDQRTTVTSFPPRPFRSNRTSTLPPSTSSSGAFSANGGTADSAGAPEIRSAANGLL